MHRLRRASQRSSRELPIHECGLRNVVLQGVEIARCSLCGTTMLSYRA